MKKITIFALILGLAILFVPNESFAQFGKLKGKLNSAKSKVTNTTKKPAASSSSKVSSSSKTTSSNSSAPAKASKGKDYYVCAATGHGKVGSKEQPAKDLASLISKLQPGDVVHIAGGVYKSRQGRGSDKIEVPVQIIGGYSPDFSTRDPWGKYKTIFTGENRYNETSTQYRLIIETDKKYPEYNGTVVVDGIIFDNGDRNFYTDDKQLKINRVANASKGKNNTPESGAIKIMVGKYTNVEVKNCVAVNTAPTGGVFSISVSKKGKAVIDNNLIINNTGEGIYAMTLYHTQNPADQCEYSITNNTILFTWRHDEMASSYSGNGLKMDAEIRKLYVANNVFGFGDEGGVDNIKKCKGLILKDNLFTGNHNYDYREFNTKMRITDIEDDSDILTEESTGNISAKITVPVSEEWAKIYAGRKIVTRAQIDSQVSAENSTANDIRSMLGLPLQGNSVASQTDVWLHRMSLEDAMKAGMKKYQGKYGCQMPQL